MSFIRIQTAKTGQGFQEKAPTCGNCTNFRSEKILVGWMKKDPTLIPEKHGTERNMRCFVGYFTVKKTSTCLMHEVKV